ncbi:DUF4178 domain-containing protein [Novosphingobium sp. FSY-8]|uniref:DUF4178 domain-containing protein n=1 Tax=Novosphingobium ovatum TaxID=1908523 RepID=A0ABW9XDX9_9SPHN|nr:DUF4178 domain-containing protein [Novosphingobium ovatum]NBC36747.1 DUF4178 domain-containing protein [Novosphingobium ovatum]
MSPLLCPSCGAPVAQRSAAMPYAVCPYCRGVIRWSSAGAESVGQAAELPFDVSPIQIGTGGALDGARFSVVGRVRWAWADGGWNEWLLAMADGTHRWLAEAMGQFQILEECPQADTAPELAGFAAGGELPLGTLVTLNGLYFVVSDSKIITCVGAEGDLPFATPAGWKMHSVDFREGEGRSLSVQRDEGGMAAYLGRYVELADLNPTNLRAIEGWDIPEALRGSVRAGGRA